MNRAEWIELLKTLSRDIEGDGREAAFDRLKETCLSITVDWMTKLYPGLKDQYEGKAGQEKKELSQMGAAMYRKVVNESQFGEYTEGLLEVLGLLINEDLVSRFRETKQQNRNRDYLELAVGLMIVPLAPVMNHNYQIGTPTLVVDSGFSQNKGYRLKYDRGVINDRQIGEVGGLGNHLPVIRTALRPAFPAEIDSYFDRLREELTSAEVLEIASKLGD